MSIARAQPWWPPIPFHRPLTGWPDAAARPDAAYGQKSVLTCMSHFTIISHYLIVNCGDDTAPKPDMLIEVVRPTPTSNQPEPNPKPTLPNWPENTPKTKLIQPVCHLYTLMTILPSPPPPHILHRAYAVAAWDARLIAADVLAHRTHQQDGDKFEQKSYMWRFH